MLSKKKPSQYLILNAIQFFPDVSIRSQLDNVGSHAINFRPVISIIFRSSQKQVSKELTRQSSYVILCLLLVCYS